MKRYGLTFFAISLAAMSSAVAMAQRAAVSPAAYLECADEFHGNSGPEMGGGGQGFGHGRPNFGPPGMWWKNPDIAQKLNLTDDQKKKMDDIFQQSRLQLIDLKANVEKREAQLEPMLAANPPDTNKVLAQIDLVAAARAELEKAVARMLLSIRGVLTADQWAKLQADRPKFPPRFGDHGPDGPGGPGGPHPYGFKGQGGPGGPINFKLPSRHGAARVDLTL
ncbi:MAG TPA: Spy/CpxP family protein refolding chaperone [Edaphobacter sp.]